MAALPPHSHHRAPLVHHLSKGLISTAAAAILHTSPSYIRQCKRKDYSGSDLLQEKYAHGVKRKRLSDETVLEVFRFLTAACPTKSGDRCLTFHQHLNDDALYQAYTATVSSPVSFHTFYRLKQWLRIRRSGQYFGQFDCYLCLRMKQIPVLMAQPSSNADTLQELSTELQQCTHHHEQTFLNAVNIR